MEADGLCGFEELKGYRSLRRNGFVSGLPEFVREKDIWKTAFRLVCSGSRLANVSLERAAQYLKSFDANPAAAAQAAEDAAAMKRYRVRFERLTAQFSFSADGLCIAVPKGVQDIVREGRILKHCVGGYAGRHVDGKVTILFLRQRLHPDLRPGA